MKSFQQFLIEISNNIKSYKGKYNGKFYYDEWINKTQRNKNEYKNIKEAEKSGNVLMCTIKYNNNEYYIDKKIEVSFFTKNRDIVKKQVYQLKDNNDDVIYFIDEENNIYFK